MVSFQFLPPTKHRIQSLDHFPVLRLMFLSFEYSGMHTTRVFWSEAYSKISLSVKSKFFSCKHSIHDFIFEKTDHLGPKVLYYGRQHLKKCLHSDHWLHSVKSPPSKNALFELAHAKKSLLNQYQRQKKSSSCHQQHGTCGCLLTQHPPPSNHQEKL